MKKFQLFVLLTAVIAAAACSSDHGDEPRITYDKAYSRALSNGLENTTYNLCDITYYDKSSLTGNKWKYFDHSEWTGMSFYAPGTMIIQGGKLYTEYETFHFSTGPKPIGMIWNAYLYATGSEQKLYLARDFVINDEDNTVEIAGHGIFTVRGINPENFEMEIVTQYGGGAGGDGGFHKEVSRYQVAEHMGVDNNILAFGSEKELVKGVIDLARAQFGDVVDLNKIYAPNVIFDNYDAHVFNLDAVARYYGVEY